MTLQRLVIETKPEEMVIRVLYRSQDGPNPGTKARQREVTDLAREGLTRALEALEAGTEVVGTSGYDVREDVLLVTTSPDVDKLAKGRDGRSTYRSGRRRTDAYDRAPLQEG